jgi:hypothetical protein
MISTFDTVILAELAGKFDRDLQPALVELRNRIEKAEGDIV